MSYCRFTEGDVYAYECDGGVQFWTPSADLDRLCNTFNEAYRYARALRDEHGLDVPSHAIEALRLDALNEALRIGILSNDFVKDLQDENAKLRQLFQDFWAWVAPPFGVGGGSPDEYVSIVERMHEMGLVVKQ